MTMSTREIADLAREIRIQILHTIKGAGMGHIGGDFLLIYQVDEDRINFVRAGTHAELFSI